MCHLEVMMTLAMRMYGDLVPFLFVIPLYHFLLLLFYNSCYLYGAGGSFCGQTKVFFQGMNIDCDNMYTISWVLF